MTMTPVLLIGTAVVAALAVGGVLVSGGIGAAQAPDSGLDIGDVTVVEADEHTFEVTVVGAASSGILACDRLVVRGAARRGDQFVIDVRRPVFAFGCNDDQVPRLARVQVTESAFAGSDDISVTQDGVPLDVEIVAPPGG